MQTIVTEGAHMGPATGEAPTAAMRPIDSANPAALPHGLTLLGVASTEPAWTSLTLQLDARGCRDSTFRWAGSIVEALSILREDAFDCVIVSDRRAGMRLGEQPASQIDPIEFVRAMRTSGHDEPVVLLSSEAGDEYLEQAIDLACTPVHLERGWESRALLPLIEQEIRRSRLKRDNLRLEIADQKRLVRERDETEHLLDRQRLILNELRELVDEAEVADEPSPATDDSMAVVESESVERFYDELLRTYVMMGSGRLEAEIEQLTQLLATAGVSLRRALDMHLTQVEKLVRGLGSRSSRHVMSRADILALELMIQLGECYRQKASDTQ